MLELKFPEVINANEVFFLLLSEKHVLPPREMGKNKPELVEQGAGLMTVRLEPWAL